MNIKFLVLPVLILLSTIGYGAQETQWESKPELFSGLCTLVVDGDASGTPHVYKPGWEEYPSKNPLIRSSDGKEITWIGGGVGTVKLYLSEYNYELEYEHDGKQFDHRGTLYISMGAKLAILKTTKGEYYMIHTLGCGSSYEVKLNGTLSCVVNLLPSLELCPGTQAL